MKNNEKYINYLNDNLKRLYLDDNQISKIENLNENLERLHLDDNNISKIENLNENLERLYLENNNIKEITQKSYDLIKKNNIKVFWVDINKLKIV